MKAKADTPEYALLMAYANLRLGNNVDMLNLVQEALKMRPEYPLAFHYKALALKGLGDLKGAEVAIRTAIQKEKDNFHHVFLLGIIQWSTGDMKAAEESLKKSITYSPNESVFLVEYATFLIHRGRFDEALDAAYKAKSIDKETAKLEEVIESAKQKEFQEGIDDLVYLPPLPYHEGSAIPYNKLGNYYLQNDFLSNSVVHFSKSLKYDPNNSEAMAGFATALRLKEGGFYHFTRNFAHFLLHWYIMVVLVGLIGLLSYVAYRDREIMLVPAVSIVLGLVLMIGIILYLGLANKTSDEYKKILSEWNAENIDQLMAKMTEATTEVQRRRLEQEAVQNKARSLQGLSNFCALLFWICFLFQIGLVNLDISALPIENQQLIQTMKVVAAIGIILAVGFAIWLRTKSRGMLQETQA